MEQARKMNVVTSPILKNGRLIFTCYHRTYVAEAISGTGYAERAASDKGEDLKSDKEKAVEETDSDTRESYSTK
jgi:hypothetical protein